jgi:hypothetical protein
MTVIAWDGTTMAADKRVTFHGTGITSTKIARVGDYLVGVAGQASFGGAFREWVAGGMLSADYPRPCEVAIAMLVSREGAVSLYEQTAYPTTVEDRFAAVGSGKECALAALYLGHSARVAVEVACVFDDGSGNGVDTLTFEDAL